MTTYVLDKSQYLTYRAVFKQLAHDRTLTASMIIINNFVRGLPLNRGFTNITNSNKLNCSCLREDHAFREAKNYITFQLKRPTYRCSLLEALPATVLDAWHPELWDAKVST